MKVLLHAALFLTFSALPLFGVTQEGKVYVARENILLTDKGMFLKVEDGFIRIHTLHADEKGFYVSKTTFFNPDKQRYFEKGKSR